MIASVKCRGRQHRGRLGRSGATALGLETHPLLPDPGLRGHAAAHEGGQRGGEPPQYDGEAHQRDQEERDRDHRQRHSRPVTPLPRHVEDQLLELDAAACTGDELGQVPQRPGEDGRQERNHHQHPAGHEAPCVGTQLGDPRVDGVTWPQAAQHRADPREEVGYAGHVGHDVVAVEPDDWNELLQHLQLQRERGQKQQPASGGGVGGR